MGVLLHLGDTMNGQEVIQATIPNEFAQIASVLQLDAQLLGDYSTKAVNGRHLQEVLESTKDHTDWAKRQIIRLGLVQGDDYEILSILGTPFGGSREISLKKAIPQNLIQTYCFTMDTAKTIAMISEAKNGATVRKYFLHMERVAQEAYRGNTPKTEYEPTPAIHVEPLCNNPTNEDVAFHSFQSKASRMVSVLNLGWGKGALQKVIGQIALDVDATYNTQISRLIPAPTALPHQKEELDLAKGEHMLRQVIGSKECNLNQFKDLFGLKTTTPLNQTLTALGYQVALRDAKKKSNSGYQIVQGRESYAIQIPIATGMFKGQFKISAWILNSFSESEKEKIMLHLRKHYTANDFK